MAKQSGIIKFTGKLGDIVGYRNGKDYCLRSHPTLIKQTTATRRTAQDFGTASKSGKLIRHSLHKMIDPSITNRLNKALGEIIRADMHRQAGRRQITTAGIMALQGFRFNSHATISCTPVIERNNKEISIALPESYGKAAIRAIALSVNFQQQTTKVISAEYDGQHPMILHTNGKDITLILLEIKEGLNRKKYVLDIIAVYPPQEQEQPKKIKKTSAPKLMVIPHYTKRVTPSLTLVKQDSPPGG